MFLDSRNLNEEESNVFQPLLEHGVILKSILMPDIDDSKGEWIYFAQKGNWTMHFYLINLDNEKHVDFILSNLLKSMKESIDLK